MPSLLDQINQDFHSSGNGRGVVAYRPTVPRFQPTGRQQQPRRPVTDARTGNGSTLDQMLGAFTPREPKAAAGGPGGSVGRGLGVLLNNPLTRNLAVPLNMLDTGRRAGVLAFENIAPNVPGLRSIIDEEAIADDDRSMLDKLRDPHYGFGEIVEKTGNKWLDRAAGLAGDIALDPLTYLTAGVGGVAGKGGRVGLAAEAAYKGMPEATVAAIGRYGPGVLRSTEDLTELGLRQQGLRFMGQRVPGTGAAARKVNQGVAITRDLINRAPGMSTLRQWRAPQGLEAAWEKILTGNGPGTVRGAAARIDWDQAERLGRGGFRGVFSQEIEHLSRGLDDNAAVAATKATQDPATHTEWNDLFARMRQKADEAGVYVPERNPETYAPFIWTPEGRQVLAGDTPAAKAIREHFNITIDDLEASGATLRRKFIARKEPYTIGGREVRFDKMGIENFNQALNTAFPELGGNVKFLDDNIRSIAHSYLNRLADDVGQVSAAKYMSGAANSLVADESEQRIMQEVIDDVATKHANEATAAELRNTITKLEETTGRIRDETARGVNSIQTLIGDPLKDALSQHRTLRDEAYQRLNKALHQDMRLQKNRTAAVAAYDAEIGGIRRRLRTAKAQIDRIDARIEAEEALKPGVRPAAQAARRRELRALRKTYEERFNALRSDLEALSAISDRLKVIDIKGGVLERNIDNPHFVRATMAEDITVPPVTEPQGPRQVQRGRTPEQLEEIYNERRNQIIRDSEFDVPEPVQPRPRKYNDQQIDRWGYEIQQAKERLNTLQYDMPGGAPGRFRLQTDVTLAKSELQNLRLAPHRLGPRHPRVQAARAKLREAEAALKRFDRETGAGRLERRLKQIEEPYNEALEERARHARGPETPRHRSTNDKLRDLELERTEVMRTAKGNVIQRPQADKIITPGYNRGIQLPPAKEELAAKLEQLAADTGNKFTPTPEMQAAVNAPKTEINAGSVEPRARGKRIAEDGHRAAQVREELFDRGVVDQDFLDRFDWLRINLDEAQAQYTEFPSAATRERLVALTSDLRRHNEFVLRMKAALDQGIEPSEGLSNYTTRTILAQERASVVEEIRQIKRGKTAVPDYEVDRMVEIMESVAQDVNDSVGELHWTRALTRMNEMPPAEQIALLQERIPFNEQWIAERERTLRNTLRRRNYHAKHPNARGRLSKGPPNLTPEERAVNLARAGEARQAIAEVRRALRLEEMSLTEVFESSNPLLRNMKIKDAMSAMPDTGRLRASIILDDLGISPKQKIGTMGKRHREALFERLGLEGVPVRPYPPSEYEGAARRLHNKSIRMRNQIEGAKQYVAEMKERLANLSAGGLDDNLKGVRKVFEDMAGPITDEQMELLAVALGRDNAAILQRISIDFFSGGDRQSVVEAGREVLQRAMANHPEAFTSQVLDNVDDLNPAAVMEGLKGAAIQMAKDRQDEAFKEFGSVFNLMGLRRGEDMGKFASIGFSPNRGTLNRAQLRRVVEQKINRDRGVITDLTRRRLDELEVRRTRLEQMEEMLGKTRRRPSTPPLPDKPVRPTAPTMKKGDVAGNAAKREEHRAAMAQYNAEMSAWNRQARIRKARMTAREELATEVSTRLPRADWRTALGAGSPQPSIGDRPGRVSGALTRNSPAAQERMLRSQYGALEQQEELLRTRYGQLQSERGFIEETAQPLRERVRTEQPEVEALGQQIEATRGASLTPEIDERIAALAAQRGASAADAAAAAARRQELQDAVVKVDEELLGVRSALRDSISPEYGSQRQRVSELSAQVDLASRRHPKTTNEMYKYLDELDGLVDDTVDPADPIHNMTKTLLANAQDQVMKEAELGMQVSDANKLLAAANKGELETVFKSQLADGWREILRTQTYGKNKFAMADELSAYMNNVSKEMSSGRFWKVMEAYTNFFKTYATATPGFHLRNAISATFMNSSDGVGAKYNFQALSLWRRMKGSGMSPYEFFTTKATPRERKALEVVWASGAGGPFAERGVGPAGGMTSKILNNRYTRLSRRMGEWVEGPVRLAMALDSIDKGMDASRALNRITRVHFDYSQVSKMDEKAKRLIPFWTFMSRNLPLQITQMWMKPRLYAHYNSLIRNFSEENDVLTPNYWLEQGGFNTGMELGGVPMYLAPDLPHTRVAEDVNRLGDPARLLSQMNPAFRVPLEVIAANRKLYTGVPFEKDKYEKVSPEMMLFAPLMAMLNQMETGGTSGDPLMSQKGAYALRELLPPLQQLSRLFPREGDTLNEERRESNWLKFGGLPVYQLTENQRQGEARRRVAEANAMQRHLAAVAAG